MSALRKRVKSKAPVFRTSEYVDVDIDIDPEELEAAGWVYVGTGGGEVPKETAVDAVRRFHDADHQTSWRFCLNEPRYSLNREQGIA